MTTGKIVTFLTRRPFAERFQPGPQHKQNHGIK